jgi:hypothetical protein
MFAPLESGGELNNRHGAAEMADGHALIPAYLNADR